ncbi:MAG: hypothetical protein LUD81_03430, partial [Clostridiales bacterium]|nr:hypothetical protein [Clostridiales bacterium]
AFQLSFKNYEYERLNFNAAATVNMQSEGNSLYTSGSGEASVEFNNINTEIGTIEVRTHSEEGKKVKINIDYSDETNRAYRRNIASVEAVNDCDKSFIIPCNASGKISSMKFRLTPENNDTVEIESIVINKPIPFRFSLIRILLILCIALLKYMLCDAPGFKKSFAESRVFCIRCARLVTFLFIAAAFALIIFQRSEGLENILNDFKSTSGNQITQEIVDAFEKGQTSLLDSVPEELINLDNPYDWSQRDGISYKWDHLMYDGKYYSYYGIASVIFLFLPYHIITGYYFPTQWAVFLFGALGIYFLYKLYMEYIGEFFKNLKISFVLTGLVMLETISGIWFCFPTTNFYEIAQTSGFLFCTSGFYFLLRSGVIGGRSINNKILALSSVLFSLAVLSRPTLALYCICALVFIYGGFKKA